MLTSEHGMIGGRSSTGGSSEACLSFARGTVKSGDRKFSSLQGGWSMTDLGSADARADRYREVAT